MQKLAQTNYTVDHLTEEIDNRKSRLSALLAETQEFQDACDRFDKWLKATEKTLQGQKPLSVNPEQLNNQALTHEVCLVYLTVFQIQVIGRVPFKYTVCLGGEVVLDIANTEPSVIYLTL